MNNLRFHHISLQEIRFFCVLLICVILTGSLYAQNRPEKKTQTISVSLKVVDDKGVPVPNAKVVVGEGIVHSYTNENGASAFSANPGKIVTISAPGYEKNVSTVQYIAKNSTIQLMKSGLFLTSDDNVPLPFNTEKRRFMTGSANTLTSDQLEKYPSNDLRNAFTGLVPGLQVTEFNGSPGLSAEERLGVYGITNKLGVAARGRSMMYIIDDVPTDITEMALDPQEIESVAIIKDIVGKTMYGPIAADGIIFIKTKRGSKNERLLKVNIEDGVSVIDRFPGMTSGIDYARLNNSARQNDGLAALYSDQDIAAYAKNNPYDMYHPSSNFRDLMLKNAKSFKRFNVSSSGGNDVVQYSAYLGYNGEGDIYKIGATADYNRLNVRSNIDVKINEDFNIKFGISAGLTNRRSPNYGYSTSEGSSTSLIEFDSALSDMNNTPPNAFPVYANNDPSLKFPWFGVSPVYKVNPIGNLIGQGYFTETGRKGSANIAVNYDFSKLIKGLTSQTSFGFDVYDLIRLGKAQDYIAYIATPSKTPAGNDTILLAKAHNGVVSADLINLHDYYYQKFSFFEKLNYQKSFGVHDIQSTLTYLIYKASRNGIEEPERQQNVVWAVNYTNNDKYILKGVLNYAGTYTLNKSQRTKFFPSIGAGWIVSEESFMSHLKFVNFLKLRAEAGILGYENFMTPFLYRDRWLYGNGSNFGPYTTGTKWFGTTQSTPTVVYPNRIANPGITWETRKEFSIGLDAMMFNNKLSLEFTYYNNLRDGIVTQLPNSMPYVAGLSAALPWFNFNQTRYFGIESKLQFTDKTGKLEYSFGGNATLQNSRIEKYDEPAYRFNYQFTKGRPADAYWGLTYLGKFLTDAETKVIPQIYDEVLKQGDLKYKDMNGDGVIDDNDRTVIGHTTPRIFYALNANLKYRNFELTLIGTGAALYDIPLTNSYFMSGWGDNNYSNFVKENIGGAYPRLTYYKVNNNFVASDFWLTKGGYFKLQNVELAYNISSNRLNKVRSQGIRFFVRGANLVTISKVKDVDPESINSGVTMYPLFKTFTGGVKLTF
jgi:TonB-linked SusC/RagA family outer membrane protein